jgi:arsenical pump membrane protein
VPTLAHLSAEVVAVGALLALLVTAYRHPSGRAEALVAVAAAGAALATGLVSLDHAGDAVRHLAPVVAFLATILVVSDVCARAGLFAALGRLLRPDRGHGPRRLFAAAFLVAAAVTAVLSLDATVVLLTPVVLGAVRRLKVPASPHLYACTHLANSASLLLPVSNLTNLLAFAASGLTFGGFAALMALPWLAVIAVEYAIFRRFYADDLRAVPAPRQDPPPRRAAPAYPLVVLGLTLVAFPVGEPFGVPPALVAVLGALALAVPRLVRKPAREAVRIVREANPAFCAFVLALGVVVLGVREHGLGELVDRLAPDSATLLGLLMAAALGAVLANLVNNLPATLLLLPAVGQAPGLVLAMLIGVNVGPNLTYAGSLATLLWRQILHVRDIRPTGWEFTRLGALTVPAGLVAGVLALWLGLQFWGGG